MFSIKDARKKLGKRSEELTDKEIQEILNAIYYICDKVIEQVINSRPNEVS